MDIIAAAVQACVRKREREREPWEEGESIALSFLFAATSYNL